MFVNRAPHRCRVSTFFALLFVLFILIEKGESEEKERGERIEGRKREVRRCFVF